MTDGAPSRTIPNLLTPVSAGMPATQVLNDIVRTVMHPALKAEGFRKSGRTWREGDAERGWVLLQIEGSKFKLTSEWIHDPHPITLRPLLIQWRREAGLPDVPLS